MYLNRREVLLPLGLSAVLSALVLLLTGCGQTETTTPGPVGNPFDAVQVGSDSTFEVMTWNLENFPKSVTTVDWVTQVIEGVRPDVLAIMEMTSPSAFAQLDVALDGWTGSAASGAPMQQNLAFLYRTDGGLEVTSIYEIFGDYWREFPRSPYVLEGTWKGTPIVVIANHLKASGDGVLVASDPNDEETRRRDACVMLAEYTKTQLAGKRVFIVGDMNDELTDAAPNNVFEAFLADPDTFRFADMAIAQDPNGVWSYPESPRGHIDHIIVTSSLFAALDSPLALTEVIPLNQYMAGYLAQVSDHLPVIVRLQP